MMPAMRRDCTKEAMPGHEARAVLVTASSALGWIAMVGSGEVLRQLSFGHSSAREAIGALDAKWQELARRGTWNRDLVRRLRAYAARERVDFSDVRIDLAGMSDFQRRVVECCRRIPYGQTRTYGELAAMAGSPRAARAVGNCMAANRFPLIVPCHRVVPADGRLGAFSAPGGTKTKQRLLEMEAGL